MAILLVLASGWPENALAAIRSYEAVSAESASKEDIKTALLIGSSETRAAVDRGNVKEQRLYRELDRKVAENERTLRQLKTSAAAKANLLAENKQLRARQRDLIAELERKDAEYKTSIRAFREGLTGLLDSPDPRIADALQRYANGDPKALDDLQELNDLIWNAREAGQRAQRAADQRAVARIWSDARTKGERTPAQVLSLWEKAARLDSENFETWMMISQLQRILGDVKSQSSAAERARMLARNPAELGAALDELGETALAEGRIGDAAKYYEESLRNAQSWLRQKPNDLRRQADVSVALNRLGDAAWNAGKPDEARSYYQQALAIRRRVQHALPEMQGPFRDLGVVLARLGNLELAEGNLSEARKYANEAADIFVALGNMNQRSEVSGLDEAQAYRDLAYVAAAQGDLQLAEKLLGWSFNSYSQLYQFEPRSSFYLSDFALVMRQLVSVETRTEHWDNARLTLERYLRILKAEPSFGAIDTLRELYVIEALEKSAFVARQQSRTADQLAAYKEAKDRISSLRARDDAKHDLTAEYRSLLSKAELGLPLIQ